MVNKVFIIFRGIAEVPEVSDALTTNAIINQTEDALNLSNVGSLEGEPEYYISNYPYQSQEQGDLTFNAGEVIAVYKKEGDWWTGKIGDNVGIFPSNYVQKVDVVSDMDLCVFVFTNISVVFLCLLEFCIY